MDTNNAIRIIEALASGCSPFTGKLLHNESVLNQRDVIRALQIAIDHLKNETISNHNNVLISDTHIQEVIKIFKDVKRNPTPNNLTEFFLGGRNFKDKSIVSHPLYGKLKNTYSKGKLLDYFTNNFFDRTSNYGENLKKDLYKEIDYFQKEKFNKLSDKAILQLKEKINQLEVQKKENLPEYIQTARLINPRAYEPWSDIEMDLLSKAIEYTNDLNLLSQCFLRGRGSIESCGQRIIYQSKKNSYSQATHDNNNVI